MVDKSNTSTRVTGEDIDTSEFMAADVHGHFHIFEPERIPWNEYVVDDELRHRVFVVMRPRANLV